MLSLIPLALVNLLVGSTVATSVSIIDIISERGEFTELVYHLQRTGLVPLINESRNATLIAPVNSAFYNLSDSDVTRDRLIYHLLNSSVVTNNTENGLMIPSYLKAPNVEDGSTVPVLFSSGSSYKDSKYVPPSFNHIDVVEANINASFGRGLVQVVDRLLAVPNTICETLAYHKLSVDEYYRVFDYEVDCLSSQKRESLLTVFAQTNDAFNRWSKIELNYLQHPRAEEDRKALLKRHIATGIVQPDTDFEMLDGSRFHISRNGTLNSTYTAIKSKPLIASDGIIRLYDQLLGDDTVIFDTQKYLYSLGADSFVGEVNFNGLSHLINGSSRDVEMTIIVPSSIESMNIDAATEQQMLPKLAKVDKHVSSSVLYHFVNGTIEPDLEEKYTLYDTFLASKKLFGNNQKIKMIHSMSGDLYANDYGHKIIAGPFNVDNTTLYSVNSDLDRPLTLSVVLGPFFQSSYSVSFLDQLGLLEPSNLQNARTILLPDSSAWDSQSLIKEYLEINETALRAVFSNLILNEPMYTNSQPHMVPILAGGSREARFSDEKDVIYVGPAEYHISVPDILFEGGVVHTVKDLSIPLGVEILPDDLIDLGERSYFSDLLRQRNFSQYLTREEPCILFVPPTKVLESHDVTAEFDDIDTLLKLHILPGASLEQLLAGEEVSTLVEGVKVATRSVTAGVFVLSIVNGDEKEIHLIKLGTAQFVPRTEPGTTIIYVDYFLSPKWIVHPSPFLPPFRLKTHVAILIGVALGAILISGLLAVALLWCSRYKKDKLLERPVGSRRHSRQPSIQNSDYGSINRDDEVSSSTSTLPSNQQVNPIPAIKVHSQREFGKTKNLPAVQ